jgi:ABC-type uncharacterized transport system permease subunit
MAFALRAIGSLFSLAGAYLLILNLGFKVMCYRAGWTFIAIGIVIDSCSLLV